MAAIWRGTPLLPAPWGSEQIDIIEAFLRRVRHPLANAQALGGLITQLPDNATIGVIPLGHR